MSRKKKNIISKHITWKTSCLKNRILKKAYLYFPNKKVMKKTYFNTNFPSQTYFLPYESCKCFKLSFIFYAISWIFPYLGFPTRSKFPHPRLFLINANSASIPIHLTNFKATNAITQPQKATFNKRAIKSSFSSLNEKPKRKPQENTFSKPKKRKENQQQNVNIIEGCSVAAASSLQLIGFPCPTFEEY